MQAQVVAFYLYDGVTLFTVPTIRCLSKVRTLLKVLQVQRIQFIQECPNPPLQACASAMGVVLGD